MIRKLLAIFALVLVVGGLYLLLGIASDDVAGIVAFFQLFLVLLAFACVLGNPNWRRSFWLGFFVVNFGFHLLTAVPIYFTGSTGGYINDLAEDFYENVFLPVDESRSDGVFYYRVRGSDRIYWVGYNEAGERTQLGAMTPSQLKSRNMELGISEAQIPTAPDRGAFNTLIREFVALLGGMIGGIVTCGCWSRRARDAEKAS